MGCSSGAGDLTDFTWETTYFELRLSSACKAVWARTTNNSYPCYGGAAWVHSYYDYAMTQWAGSEYINQGCFSQQWSKMRSFTYWIKFCYEDHYRGINYCRGPY
jgi:hypothetical protein